MAPFSRSSSRSSEIGRSVAILAVAVGGAIGNARAQCLDARLGPWFGFFNGDFGTSVALDGSVVAVGEPEGFTSSTGTVFMFRFDGTEWNEEARIQPSDSEVRSFGASIGVEGDVAAIGAPLHTQSAGAVFIHRYDGVAWVREASLVGSDVSHGDRFGSAVAISGNRVIGGASSYGAAYVFEHDGAAWSEVVKLTPPIGSFVSYFGTSVDLEDSLAVIGAPGGSANPAGAAFVYRREGGAWVWEATLTSAPEEFDRFGAAVALHGSRIVVGAPGDDEAGAQAGAVYVFEKIGSDWTEIDKLVPPSSVEGEFGTSVTVWGDRIVGGAPDHATGTAYLFTLDQGQWVGTEIANPEPYFGYGVAVAIQDDCLMITSEHNASDDEGAVFGYRLDANGRDCNTNGMCDGEEILADPTLDCNGNIIPDACEDLGGDCNTNGVPDACDIADDTSLDCDANGVPDECDLAFGAPDLNANGIPDTCDGRFEDQVIGQPGTLADDRLGFAVALSGSLMVAGAPATNSNAGAAYLFEHDGAAWVPLQELVPDENSMGDQFGFAVGIGTDTIFVAAPFDDDLGSSSGSVFAFRFDGQSWIQDQQIFAADETTFDRFGFSLAARGDQLIVGAIGESDLGSFSGAAYAFAQVDAQWVQTTKLVAGDGAAHEQFGSAVDTDGDVLIIGAWQDDDGGFWAGSAYIYRWSGTSWDFETKLLAGDTDEEDKFGAAVSISGNRAIVGAPETRGFAIGPGGIAYLFEYDGSTWRETGRLMDESYVGGRLGASVAIEGDIAIVGVPDGVLDGVGLPGLAYIYRHCGDGWTRKAAFAGVGTPDAGQFGWSVAIDQERAVIGAEHGTGAGPATGSLHVFDDLASPGADCNENGICDECDVINGTSTDCNGNLVPDECD
ncbi:MAG: hypothetical protein GY715_21130, partial [Planctomycetes bacterium]|nr:hypothetical protein [Planctomycetota bacterium]